MGRLHDVGTAALAFLKLGTAIAIGSIIPGSNAAIAGYIATESAYASAGALLSLFWD